MENNSNRKSRKGIIIVVVIILIIGILAGTWFGSKAYYAKQPKTIKVNASAKVYPYVDLPMLSTIVLVGGSMENAEQQKSCKTFAEIIREFSDKPIEELIDTKSFPIEVPVIGSVEGPDGTCYIVQGSSGNYYVIVP